MVQSILKKPPSAFFHCY